MRSEHSTSDAKVREEAMERVETPGYQRSDARVKVSKDRRCSSFINLRNAPLNLIPQCVSVSRILNASAAIYTSWHAELPLISVRSFEKTDTLTADQLP